MSEIFSNFAPIMAFFSDKLLITEIKDNKYEYFLQMAKALPRAHR